jgi:hypothetical protein
MTVVPRFENGDDDDRERVTNRVVIIDRSDH